METEKQIKERRKRLEEFAKNDLANKLIEEANKKMTCGTKCAERQATNDLKQKYDNANKNLKNAPGELFNARRNYFTYAFGQNYYKNFREKQIKKTVDDLGNKLTGNHNEFMKILNNSLESYKMSVTYFTNMVAIYDKYDQDIENNRLKLDSKINEYNLNARRVDYEEDEISNMKFYLFISIITYFVCFGVFIVLFLYMKLYTDRRNLGVFAFAVVLPFLIPFSLQYIFKTNEYIRENGTNFNVYLNASEM